MAQESRLAITIDSRSAEQKAKDLEQALAAMEAAGIRVVGSSRRVSSGMVGVGGAARAAIPSVDGLNKELAKTDKQAAASAATINRVLKAALAGFSAMHVIDAADNWGQYASRMRMATETTDEYNHAQQRMAQSAQLTFRDINETREAFIQLSPVLREMGLSLDQSIDAVDAFSGLLVVNGANAERGAAAMEALAKSFQRGRVDAQAWMTIYSTADTIVEHLAKSSGKTAAEIRQMGVEGKISAEMMAKALVSAYEPVIKQVEGMPTTVRDALTNLNTAFGEYIGWQNEASGATAALASGLGLLGENLSGVLNAGLVVGGAALAAYSVKTGLARIETGKLTVAKIAGANADRAAALAARSVAVARVEQARATLAAAVSEKEKLVATSLLANAERNLAAASTSVATANRALGTSMLGLVGGPIGAITLAAGLASSAFFYFQGSSERAKKTLEEMAQPLDDVVGKFKELGRTQMAGKLVEYAEIAEESAKKAEGAFISLLGSIETSDLPQFRTSKDGLFEMIEALNQAEKKGEELDAVIKGMGSKLDIPQSVLNKWLVAAANFAEAQKKANDESEKLAAVKKLYEELGTAAQESASNLTSLNAAMGIEKWDEYLKKLTDARDVIGMNAKQLGAFEAAQAGANSLQQEMAGIVTAQTDAFKKLQSAIDDKDKKAIEAAQNNIRALDIERQKVELLAIKTQALIAATNAFARGEVSGDVASGILQNMLQGFSQAEAAIAVSKEAEAQIKNIYANTNPSDSTKGGANAAKESARLLQTLRDQVAVLGMSESEMQRYQLRVAGATPEQLKMADSLLATKEAFEKTKAAQEAYKSLMLDLRTEEERTNDQFKERIKVLREAGLSAEQYQASLNKLVTSNISVVPKFDGVDASVGGSSGELIRVAQARAELDQWRAKELEQKAAYFQTVEGMEEQHAAAVLEINRHNEQQASLSDAWRSATLANFASVTGDAAEMLKGLGMEGSAIYKAMFIASKAASIAQAIVNTELAYTRALATPGGEVLAPWIRGLGYASVGVMAATSLTGMAHSGIDQIPREGTWLLDKGERVLSPRQNSDLTSYLKKANTVPAGAGGGGQPIQINVEVNIANDGTAQTNVDGAGAQQGRQLAEMVAGMVQQGLVREMRQGGLLWNQQNGYSR